MKKRIVNYILKVLGLQATDNQVRYLLASKADDNKRLCEQARRIDTIIEDMMRHSDKISSLGGCVRAIEEKIEGIDNIDDLVQGKIDDVIDDALDKINIEAKAQEAIEEAVDNATFSVRF